MEKLVSVYLFDQAGQLPDPKDTINAVEFAVSPALPGRLYEITQIFGPDGKPYAVKTLKTDALKLYRPGSSLQGVFEIHKTENSIFRQYLGEFMLPEHFCIIERKGSIICRIIQPWIIGVQFKEAVANNRFIPESQMPELDHRIRFIRGLAELLKDERVYPKIGDFTFFLLTVAKKQV